MRYAETGINLEIDLSRGSIEKEESDPRLTELYLGGSGINSKILWDRVPPEVDPFSPDNLLIFGTGILDGTPVPAANRTVVTTVSPPTYRCVNSFMGGYWGPELKHAGYDRVIIRGKSPSWVYLWIHDDKVEIRDASHLLGEGGLKAEELVREDLKEDKAQVAVIGLAGENRVWMSSIEHDSSSASKGVGVIMGDKRLKAIAVRGTKDINIARPAELLELCNGVMELRHGQQRLMTEGRGIEAGGRLAAETKAPVDMLAMGSIITVGHGEIGKEQDESFHINSFSWGNAREMLGHHWTPERQKMWAEMEKQYASGWGGCYNCPNACRLEVAYPGIQKAHIKCWGRHGWLMSAYKELDFTFKLGSIAQQLGLDDWAAPLVIAMAIELYEAGILTEQDMPGFPSDTEGRFVWLINKIARREGIGDILANGSYWATRQIGKGAEAYDHCTIKKYEQQPTKRGRLNQVFYLMHCTGEKAAITQIEGSFPQVPLPTREMREAYVKDWVQVPDEKFKQYYLDWEPRTQPTTQAVCEIVEWNETMRYIDDATGLCSWWSGFLGQMGIRVAYHIHSIPAFVSAATGMDIDEAELWTIAQRNRTLIRAINVRLGLRRVDEEAPGDHWKQREPEVEAKLKDAYYEHRGWTNDGIPTKETLDGLGLDYVSEDLERRGILTKETLVGTGKTR